ncbi:CBS domain-containing protein [Candidatus Bathyarchaeota archaeon]|nr:CBS domain-containing protein [Candidatus Bathyarchaeota archaeon]
MSLEGLIKELNSPVKDCMRIPVTVAPTESVSTVLSNMVVKDIGAVIVVDKGKPVGIITEKDVLERVIMQNKNVYFTTAKEIMSQPLVSIEENRPIKEAIDLMHRHNIRRLAVTSKDILVGLVTERRLSIKFLNKII